MDAVPTEPHRLRVTKSTPVAALGGMAFEDSSLDATVNRWRCPISFPCPWLTKGKGKKCPFMKGQKTMTFQRPDDIIRRPKKERHGSIYQ